MQERNAKDISQAAYSFPVDSCPITSLTCYIPALPPRPGNGYIVAAVHR